MIDTPYRLDPRYAVHYAEQPNTADLINELEALRHELIQAGLSPSPVIVDTEDVFFRLNVDIYAEGDDTVMFDGKEYPLSEALEILTQFF